MMTDSSQYNWKEEMGKYIEQKRGDNLAIRSQPPPKYVTEKELKQKEAQYNPILQQYNDRVTESAVRNYENKTMLSTLAQNKDRQLRYEQTFNVVNFEKKLQGLESQPDFPQEKPWYFRSKKDSNTNYNIISNIGLKEHHYDHPDKRPASVKEKEKKQKTTLTTGLRDYNLITGRYLEMHDQKVMTDQKSHKIEAANKYWETHSYDPIRAKYYDASKETEYLRKREEYEKVHGKDQIDKLPISVKNEGMLYNPINMEIEDEKRLYERDMREKNKKIRYEVKYDVEHDLHMRNLQNEERNKLMSLNKINPKKFIDNLDRGFDIITNDKFSSQTTDTMTNFQANKKPTTWDKLVSTSNDSSRLKMTSGNYNITAQIPPSQTARMTSNSFKQSNAIQLNNSPMLFTNKEEAVVNNDIKYINEGELIRNPREVKTPPAPYYEEEYELPPLVSKGSFAPSTHSNALRFNDTRDERLQKRHAKFTSQKTHEDQNPYASNYAENEPYYATRGDSGYSQGNYIPPSSENKVIQSNYSKKVSSNLSNKPPSSMRQGSVKSGSGNGSKVIVLPPSREIRTSGFQKLTGLHA